MAGRPRHDYSKLRHGRLVAQFYLRSDKRRGAVWLFKCDCGTEIERFASRVFDKDSRIYSCGCKRKEGNLSYLTQFRDSAGRFDTLRRRIYKCGKLVEVKLAK